MNKEQIESRLQEVVREIAEIKSKIGHAKAHAANTGEYANPVWFQNATAALRYRGIEHQTLLQQLGAIKKEERRKHNATMERRFVDVARVRLPYETFSRIFDEAMAGVEK